MTNTTINATINNSNIGMAATRLDIWHQAGGVGRWELTIDNCTGAINYVDFDQVVSNLGANGANLLQGTLEDIKSNVNDVSAVFSKYVTVSGRNNGVDLVRKFLIKQYVSTKLDDLIADALSTTDSEITFTSPHTAPTVDADFNKTYLQNGFVDAAKLIDYDFTVFNDKSFHLWHLSSAPSSGVLLKSVAGATDNNILLINEDRVGNDKCNYIRVDAGTLNDHWTEGNASDWTGQDCTVADDTDICVAQALSIRATFDSTDWVFLYLQLPKYNYDYLDFFDNATEELTLWLCRDCNSLFYIYLKDDVGNEITAGCLLPDVNRWFKFTVKIGSRAIYGTGFGQWDYLSGSNFTWKVKRIGVTAAGPVNGHFWIDGLQQPNTDVFAISEDP